MNARCRIFQRWVSLIPMLLCVLGLLSATPAAAAPGDLDPLDLNIIGADVMATAVQPDGKMIIAGSFSSVLGVPRGNIARLNADGTLDLGFDPKADNGLGCVVVQADGKILIGGGFSALQPNGAANPTTRHRIARLNADGTLDAGFNPMADGSVTSMVVQRDGKILIVGNFTSLQPNGAAAATTRLRIARLNADGSLDAGFNPKANLLVNVVAVQEDGKILLGGWFTTLQPTGAATAATRQYLCRLNADGTLDAGFDPKAGYHVDSVVVQADGKILLGGDFASFQPNGAVAATSRQRIARLNPDGTLDAGFDPKANDDVNNVTLQADGKILLGGWFTTLQPNGAASEIARQRIARLNADGTLDSSFDPAAGGLVYGVAVQEDGKVLLGGSFTTLQPNGAAIPTVRNRFARLINDSATQALSVPNSSRVEWLRGGSSPEAASVTFELSTDGGSVYSPLAAGKRISGGWELNGLSLPASGHLRARARTAGGFRNSSGSLVESVVAFGPPVIPTVSSVTPASGTALGGTPVTITGGNFDGVSSVSFDGVPATSINVVSPTQITALTPPHAQGIVDVAVTTSGGTGTGSGLYSYVPQSVDITVTDGLKEAIPGTSVTYAITVSNPGPDGTSASLIDHFPSILANVNWTAVGADGGTAPGAGSGNIDDAQIYLPAGGSVTFTVSATISSAATGTLTNTATVSTPPGISNPNPAIKSATDTDTLVSRADLGITNTDGIGASAVAGTSMIYTITASNAGPSDVIGATVTDIFPSEINGASWTSTGVGGGTATAAGTGNINDTVSLPAGASVTYTITAPILPSTTGFIQNTATVASSVYDPALGNNRATNNDSITRRTDLALTITDSPDPVNAPGELTYTISLTNNGPSVARPSISLPMPASTTFVSASLPSGWSFIDPNRNGGQLVISNGGVTIMSPGQTAVFNVVLKVLYSIADDSFITATATVSATTFSTDTNASNNSAAVSTKAKRIPAADLLVTLTGTPNPVTAGTELTYTIQARNNGPLDAGNFSITDTLPAGTTFVSLGIPDGWSATTPAIGASGLVVMTNPLLANGGSAAFSLKVKVEPGVDNSSSIKNSVAVSSSVVDVNPANNSSTTTSTVKSVSDLAVSITRTPAVAPKGSNVTYRISLTNHGSSDRRSPTVSFPIPSQMTFVSVGQVPEGWSANTPVVGNEGSVEFHADSLVVGQTVDFTVAARIDPNVAADTILTAVVTAPSKASTDSNLGNNSATVTTTVKSSADLRIAITGTPDTAPKGSKVTYQIELGNEGPSDAVAPRVSLPLPPQMSFVSVIDPSGWSSTKPAVGSGGTVVFSAASLAKDAAVSFTVVAKVKPTASTGATLAAIVTATPTDGDPVQANNYAADISLVGTVKPSVSQPVTTGISVNSQTGLFDVVVKVTNTTPRPLDGFRLNVNFDAYKAAYPSLRLENASSTSKKTAVYVDYPNMVALNATVGLKLSFYTRSRTFPSPFSPVLKVEPLPSARSALIPAGPVQPSISKLASQAPQLVFPTIAGHWYRVRYSSDLVHWTDALLPVQAISNCTTWTDDGPPYTESAPANTPSRFYTVEEIATP